ncbi:MULTISPECIES: transposase [unclassified Neorhizobium]|uniref:transposase n=1 Tax=unclassified Neorhizobium TaxID=2629175 RepID=UPI001FF3F2F3|nr:MULTISPECIES: transposase [unclassified Neorhizobium]MCJ9672621.1 transposase [Neorhizobium sp. SHOUNA12B]MCJ9746516.1 transposase [Neorhizobium sp. SHOUNA12A]
MADEENIELSTVSATAESAPAPSVAKKAASRRKKASVEPVRATSKAASSTRSKRHTDEDKLEKLGQIDAQLANGVTLKDAVKTVGISDQTYYQWKKAVKSEGAVRKAPVSVPVTDDLAEFTQLEEENQRLRKLLAEKLRTENAELRRRLGLE